MIIRPYTASDGDYQALVSLQHLNDPGLRLTSELLKADEQAFAFEPLPAWVYYQKDLI